MTHSNQLTELLQVEYQHLYPDMSHTEIEAAVLNFNMMREPLGEEIRGTWRIVNGRKVNYIVYYESIPQYIRDEMLSLGIGTEIRLRRTA